MTQHPFPSPVDTTHAICPVGGELQYGFSNAQILAARTSAARVAADPDGTIGAMFYQTYDSPSCGTVKVWFQIGTNDQDGLPSIMKLELENCPVPSFGHRHIVRKASDQLGVGSSATDVAELTVAVTAGRQIRFRAVLYVNTSSTTIGGMVSVNGPAANLILFETREWTSASVQSFGGQNAFDSFSAQTNGNGATTRAYWVEGIAAFSASGTFVPRVKAESGGTLDVLKGSFMEYDLI